MGRAVAVKAGNGLGEVESHQLTRAENESSDASRADDRPALVPLQRKDMEGVIWVRLVHPVVPVLREMHVHLRPHAIDRRPPRLENVELHGPVGDIRLPLRRELLVQRIDLVQPERVSSMRRRRSPSEIS